MDSWCLSKAFVDLAGTARITRYLLESEVMHQGHSRKSLSYFLLPYSLTTSSFLPLNVLSYDIIYLFLLITAF